MSKTVAAGEVQWPDILEDVKKNEEIVITENGEPVARVVPMTWRRRMTLEELRNSVTFIGDVESPVDEWDVES